MKLQDSYLEEVISESHIREYGWIVATERDWDAIVDHDR